MIVDTITFKIGSERHWKLLQLVCYGCHPVARMRMSADMQMFFFFFSSNLFLMLWCPQPMRKFIMMQRHCALSVIN